MLEGIVERCILQNRVLQVRNQYTSVTKWWPRETQFSTGIKSPSPPPPTHTLRNEVYSGPTEERPTWDPGKRKPAVLCTAWGALRVSAGPESVDSDYASDKLLTHVLIYHELNGYHIEVTWHIPVLVLQHYGAAFFVTMTLQYYATVI